MASFSKKLCRAVEKRKILYDRTLQYRVKRSHVDSAWQAVAEECHESVHSVKTRWRNIRKVLLRFMSKTNANSSAQTRKTRSRDYYLYDELQFLLPHLVNVSPEDFADSDMEFGVNTNVNDSHKEGTPESVKDHAEESNDGLSTLNASENPSISISSGSVAEKRKRESKINQLTPNKISNAPDTKSPNSVRTDEKTTLNKPIESYIISESAGDGPSQSMRFRRVNAKAQQQTDQEQNQNQETKEQNDTPLKLGERKTKTESKLRTRSKSLYLDRPVYEGSTDSDDDYNPPPLKKVAAIKDTTPSSISTIVTRKKTAIISKPVESNKEITANETTENAIKSDVAVPLPSEIVVEQQKENENASNEFLTNDVDYDDFAGIDMTLLAAAAEAEAAAAADDTVPVTIDENIVCPPSNKDASTQCDVNVEEEDEEFLQRVRKWIQVMTQRQKILFRRGIYQAYIDVYDDPREFELQKGIDKFSPMAHGVPAIFSGMTPVELRLVRHLAMAVSGHKITASSSPFANFEYKTQVASMRGSSSSNTMNNSEASTKLPSIPSNSTVSSSRTPPEKTTGIAGSSIVRTTAIALTNHNGRTGNSVPRILRKVVRVGNNNNNSNGGSPSPGNAHSTNSVLQRNPGLLRHRLVTSNANGSGFSSSDKQRVYRILPNGIVARQSPASGPSSNSNTSPNNANSPTSFSQSFAMLCSSNNSSQTPVTKSMNQFRQILPKLSTTPAVSGSKTLTTVNFNGEQKLSGISIRRHVPGATATGTGAGSVDSRTQIARRYSVCGSAPNELYTTSNKDNSLQMARRSVVSTLQPQQTNNSSDPTKVTTRVRYAQNPSVSTVQSGSLLQKFAVPSPVSFNQGSPVNKSPTNIMTGPLAGVPLNEPIPLAMTSWHTTQNNSQDEEEQDQMKLIQGMSLNSDNTEQDPISNEDTLNEPVNENDLTDIASKQNCIIASDAFESFVIKNEPLDLEEEE